MDWQNGTINQSQSAAVEYVTYIKVYIVCFRHRASLKTFPDPNTPHLLFFEGCSIKKIFFENPYEKIL